MKYKETLFFVAKCLTINHEEKNLQFIAKQIKAGNVDWDSVVKVSTAHYVFPALYCNLKRTELLSYLPEDLVSYMKHITDLNRERNLQIIEQAKEINEILTSNGITPIFLKGTGFLLQSMYEDPAERMLGDIDFIVSKDEYQKTIKVLREINYSDVIEMNYHFPSFKHYQRLQRDGKIAAVEIHKQMIIEEYADEFNYETIIKKSISKNNISFLGYEDQVALTMIAYQINDSGEFLNTISLRNAYDVFLLSRETNTLQSIKEFNKLFDPLNNFLAICGEIFSSSISFKKSGKTKKFLDVFDKIMSNDTFRKSHSKKIKRKLFTRQRLNIISKAIYRNDYRIWLFKRLTDKTWYKEKMIQLGIKSDS
tara:strand:+ start:867 stop:1964 length:1098 start_codon:yes stop_codon:yes gene_type:complete